MLRGLPSLNLSEGRVLLLGGDHVDDDGGGPERVPERRGGEPHRDGGEEREDDEQEREGRVLRRDVGLGFHGYYSPL